jgi:hypothetical protein
MVMNWTLFNTGTPIRGRVSPARRRTSRVEPTGRARGAGSWTFGGIWRGGRGDAPMRACGNRRIVALLNGWRDYDRGRRCRSRALAKRPVGTRTPVEDNTLATLVQSSGRPARIDSSYNVCRADRRLCARGGREGNDASLGSRSVPIGRAKRSATEPRRYMSDGRSSWASRRL